MWAVVGRVVVVFGVVLSGSRVLVDGDAGPVAAHRGAAEGAVDGVVVEDRLIAGGAAGQIHAACFRVCRRRGAGEDRCVAGWEEGRCGEMRRWAGVWPICAEGYHGEG